MGFEFRPAVRDQAKILLGLAGPSGSGKTLSALRLATGLGGRIAVIDTEAGRAKQYAPGISGGEGFQFDHLDLTAPFTPARYREAIEAADRAGFDVIIVDSISHSWEGVGGVLEMVEESTAKNQLQRWKEPKMQMARMVQRLLQMRAHIILCFRAKERKKIVEEGGSKQVVEDGWHPITDHALPYELTVFALLNAQRKGVPLFANFHYGKLPRNMAHLFPDGEQIGEEHGKRVAAWLRGEASGPSEPYTVTHKGRPYRTRDPEKAVQAAIRAIADGAPRGDFAALAKRLSDDGHDALATRLSLQDVEHVEIITAITPDGEVAETDSIPFDHAAQTLLGALSEADADGNARQLLKANAALVERIKDERPNDYRALAAFVGEEVSV